MARDPKYDVLFEPVRIGPKTMRNRFYQVPHCTGFGSDFPGAQAHFRGMKAEGGWAVVNTEATTVHPFSDFSGPMLQSRLWDDLDVRNWALMCERVHEHGSLAGIELHGGGSAHTGFESRIPAPHVSHVPDTTTWMGAVYAADRQELRRIQRLYVDAAKRARSAGFDIVNVHGAEAAGLPVMFLMGLHNTRTDEYGGSLENRARFWLETLEQVREAVGDDCAITARLCVDTLHGTADGVRVEEEGVGFVELADHLVDFWDLQVGGEDLANWVKDAGASRFYPENFQGSWVAKVRPHTAKPIVGVGRFTSPDTMVEVIRSGQLDLIGCARPSIADPFLPRKIEEGRLDEIRECIGCNVCVSRVNWGSTLVCTQNATSGEEYRRGWHPERFTRAANAERDVLVVGAGPAGMECAVVLGKRGLRRVHLVEADAEPGGHFRWVPELPGLAAWSRVVTWRTTQLGKLAQVELVPGTRLDAAAVREYGAEIVVVATGSRWAGDGLSPWNRAGIPGADASLPSVLTPEQVMTEGKSVDGERVVVYDADGYFVGISLAELLARQGKRATYVTPLAAPAMYTAYTGELVDLVPLLVGLGVELVTSHVVTGVEPGRISGHPTAFPGMSVGWDADAIVLATQRVAEDRLYRDLTADPVALEDAGIEAVYRVGDCLAPRQQAADAIFDAHRLAREIDSDDPAEPRPYIRERRVVGAVDADYEAILELRSGSRG
jgi:dimethylamine/trimethylamine dehydrogenase